MSGPAGWSPQNPSQVERHESYVATSVAVFRNKASAVYGFTVHPPPGESMVPPACVAWCNMTRDPKSFLVASNVASLQQLFNG